MHPLEELERSHIRASSSFEHPLQVERRTPLTASHKFCEPYREALSLNTDPNRKRSASWPKREVC